VAAAQRGDEEALEALLALSLPLVYNVVGKALHGGPDVDDVVQETMLRVVRGLPGLKEPQRFRAWLISIAYRQLQDRGRSVRAATALGPLVEDVNEWADPGPDVVDSTVFRMHLAGERRETNEASRWLGPSDQRVLALWWQEAAGLITRGDLARGLGLTPAHAAVRVQRAKAQLALARTILRAWHARPRCAELAAAAGRLLGPSDPRWFKRLSRHVRRCERCASFEHELIPAEHLLAGASLAPVLAGLAGAAGVAAGAAKPAGVTAVGLWEVLQRAVRELAVRPALLGGTAAVAAATVVVSAVYYLPYDRPDPGPPPPVAASWTPGPGISPTGSPTPSTPPPTSQSPGGGFNGVASASYYVAPTGSDGNPGTLNQPFATLGKAVSVVAPGETIALRGGRYQPTEPVEITTSGAADRRIVLSNYRGERPVIDAARLPGDSAFVSHDADYWTVQGLEIHGAPSHAYICRSCGHNVFRLLSIHDNGETGLILRGPDTVGNQILDSDFFRNHDDAGRGEFSDGLGIEYGSGAGNVVRGCRLYENADDGLGLNEFSSPVTIDGTWSFGNGMNRWGIVDFAGDGYGFKLGGGDAGSVVDHVITNSAAWDNATYGFTESSNAGALTVRNNTAFRNGKTGFAFVESAAVLRNNLAAGNGRDVDLGGRVDAAGNSWDSATPAGADLVGMDTVSAFAPRTADGRLPRTTFLSSRNGLGASTTA
jgi:RNA polymerase sigma factor (sigma-70 family)